MVEEEVESNWVNRDERWVFNDEYVDDNSSPDERIIRWEQNDWFRNGNWYSSSKKDEGSRECWIRLRMNNIVGLSFNNGRFISNEWLEFDKSIKE